MKCVVFILGILIAGCSFDPGASRNFETSEGRDVSGGGEMSVEEEDASGGLDVSLPPNDMFSPVDMTSGPDTGRDMSTDPPDMHDMQNVPDMLSNMRMCDGQLVDVRISTAHCGECGNGCDATFGVCRGGQCECYDPYTACGAENVCTDDLYDPKNCGQCGTTCEANEVCDAGQCVCYPGFELCNGECVDTEKDPRHCGGCGDNCNGDVCREGNCERRNGCGLTWFECPVQNAGTACVRPEPNPAFCGATVLDECGNPCGPAEICYRQGAFENFECREFRPAIGCTSCPCGNCQGEFCVESDEVDDVVFCVKDQ